MTLTSHPPIQAPLFLLDWKPKPNSYWTTKLGGAEFKVQRLQDSTATETILDQPDNVVNYITPQLDGSVRYSADVENFIVINLNTRRRAIGWTVMSQGTLDTLLVHAREVFKQAILMNASAVVLAHNHPSGDPTQSEADIKVTRDLIRGGQLLKIDVVDHVILGRATIDRPKSWSSLRELGYFYS